MTKYVAFKNIMTNKIRIVMLIAKSLIDVYHWANANRLPGERVYDIH